jgi:hypothetical protein
MFEKGLAQGGREVSVVSATLPSRLSAAARLASWELRLFS